MLTRALVLNVVFLVKTNCTSQSREKYFENIMQYDKHSPGNNSIASHRVRSVIECLSTCIATSQCLSTFYHEHKETCLTTQFRLTSLNMRNVELVLEDGWRYFQGEILNFGFL